MDILTSERLDTLREKAQKGSITEDEFVEMMQMASGRDADTAREMYHTSYAASLDPEYGKAYVS